MKEMWSEFIPPELYLSKATHKGNLCGNITSVITHLAAG